MVWPIRYVNLFSVGWAAIGTNLSSGVVQKQVEKTRMKMQCTPYAMACHGVGQNRSLTSSTRNLKQKKRLHKGPSWYHKIIKYIFVVKQPDAEIMSHLVHMGCSCFIHLIYLHYD